MSADTEAGSATPALTALFSAPFLGGSELFNLDYLSRARYRGVQVDAVVPADGAVAAALAGTARTIRVVSMPRSLRGVSRFDARLPALRLPVSAAGLATYSARLRAALARTAGPVCCLGFRSQLAVGTQPLLRRPVAWVVHELVPPGPLAGLWRRAARRAATVLALSQAAAEQPALAGVEVTVIRPSLRLAPFAALPAPASPPRRVGLIGDLFPLKNHDGLVELVARLRRRGLDVEGVIAGRDQSARPGQLRDYAERLKAATAAPDAHVELVSPGPEGMPDVLARIDVLVHLSSVPESFGRVCVEAMAAGRPVVAFGWGALPEVVRDGEAGVLCPPGDLDAVEDAVAGLIADPTLFSTLATGARHRALELYGEREAEGTIGDVLADLAYDQVASRGLGGLASA